MKADANTAVVLLHKREAARDEGLGRFLQHELGLHGCQAFSDQHLRPGLEWAQQIEARIRSSDAVIPLLSSDSMQSEMLGFEVEMAHEASQLQQGRPRLLPVRVNYTGPLPEPLSSILDPLPYFLWEGEHDNLGLATELKDALDHLARPSVKSNFKRPRG